jgi:hypothetical protein
MTVVKKAVETKLALIFLLSNGADHKFKHYLSNLKKAFTTKLIT